MRLACFEFLKQEGEQLGCWILLMRLLHMYPQSGLAKNPNVLKKPKKPGFFMGFLFFFPKKRFFWGFFTEKKIIYKSPIFVNSELVNHFQINHDLNYYYKTYIMDLF